LKLKYKAATMCLSKKEQTKLECAEISDKMTAFKAWHFTIEESQFPSSLANPCQKVSMQCL